MKWFDKVERKLGRYAIPNLMRYMVIVSIIGSVIGLVVPGFYEMYLSLNVYAILHGQVWRIVTVLFYPYGSTDQYDILWYHAVCVLLDRQYVRADLGKISI